MGKNLFIDVSGAGPFEIITWRTNILIVPGKDEYKIIYKATDMCFEKYVTAKIYKEDLSSEKWNISVENSFLIISDGIRTFEFPLNIKVSH